MINCIAKNSEMLIYKDFFLPTCRRNSGLNPILHITDGNVSETILAILADCPDKFLVLINPYTIILKNFIKNIEDCLKDNDLLVADHIQGRIDYSFLVIKKNYNNIKLFEEIAAFKSKSESYIFQDFLWKKKHIQWRFLPESYSNGGPDSFFIIKNNSDVKTLKSISTKFRKIAL